MPVTSHTCTTSTAPSPPRHLTRTRVFDDGIELNWIPPRKPNGDIQHYIIKYITQDGTQQKINTANNINYYNLTGLERGQTYNNIRVVAVNSAGGGGGSQPITSYVHIPTVESTSELELEVLRILLKISHLIIILSCLHQLDSQGTPTPSPTTSILSPSTSTPNDGTTVPQDTTGTATLSLQYWFCHIMLYKIIINLVTLIPIVNTWAGG